MVNFGKYCIKCSWLYWEYYSWNEQIRWQNERTWTHFVCPIPILYLLYWAFSKSSWEIEKVAGNQKVLRQISGFLLHSSSAEKLCLFALQYIGSILPYIAEKKFSITHAWWSTSQLKFDFLVYKKVEQNRKKSREKYC